MRKSLICIIVILLSFITTVQSNTQYSFLRLDNLNGLVNNQITCFLKDSEGFIWIGTTAGLSRYDGYEFVNFQHSIGDTASIADNYIVSLQEDKTGNIWIETRWDYVFYDVVKQKFHTNLDEVLGTKNLNDEIQNIYIDEGKRTWIKTYRNGCYELLNYETNKLTMPIMTNAKLTRKVVSFFQKKDCYYYLYDDGFIEVFNASNSQLLNTLDYLVDKINDKSIKTNLYVDNDGDLWFCGNNKGLYQYQKENKVWKHYCVDAGESRLSSDIVTMAVQDEKGLIWIGTDHGGINILNKYNGDIKYLTNQEDNQKSIPQNSITALIVDNNGIIWIGTYKNGLCYYHESIHKFPHYKHLLSDPNSLPYNDVNCFVEDRKGNLWIGTNGGGLIYYNRSKQTYTTYKKKKGGTNSLSSNVIVSLFVDKDDILWIGTFTGGLDKFDGKKFTCYFNDVNNDSSLPNNNIWSITEDDKGVILVGTLGAGIVCFDKNKERFYDLENKGKLGLLSKYINQLYKLRNGNLFIATADGITFYDTKEHRYKNHPYKDTEEPFRISGKSVNAVYEDSRGLLWVASREGTYVINPETNFLKKFTAKDGLSEVFCNCILEDEFHSIWISKSDGLSQIVVNQNMPGSDFNFSVYDYTLEDGLQSKEFNTQAAYKTSKNELIFGGPNGFNMFLAKNIKYNRVVPHVVFTDFTIFKESIKPEEKYDNKVIINKAVSKTKYIEIKHSWNMFSIKFAALDFFIPGKVHFKYKLEGFDTDWREAALNMHEVTYTNLNAGVYKFKVIAKNNDGFSSEEPAELTIRILPPFYASIPAYILYIIVLLAIILFFRYNMLRRERLKFSIEQERILTRRHREMDEMKLRFLTNVSHEFRTPLTLILTPLEKLLKHISNDQDLKMLQIIEKNATHLLMLVNQLLDFRELDLHGLRFHPIYGDVIGFIKEVCSNFSESFSKKSIDFYYKSNREQYMFDFDKDKLQKIMMNLLSNALKFTPESGSVRVNVNIEEHNGKDLILISVKDSGIGIDPEEKEAIFKRFYQSENNKIMGLSGSGIGLNLTKEMVQLHNGTITVNSIPGKGAEFIVSLPVLVVKENNDKVVVSETRLENFQISGKEEPLNVNNKEGYTLLLVEDNLDFRTFMKDSLGSEFNIVEASDGEAAFNQVYNIQPDLIISDVMMPKMDGLELCKKLRGDIRSSHIPIILLTARTADEDKIKGLEIGADDYITKPFNMDLLMLRVHKLIEKRASMQKQFQKNMEVNPSVIKITSMDEKLINKAIGLVEKNMSEDNFSVEELSSQLGMSRVYLYKKLLAITGKTPVEFIRIIRLKRGAQLLRESQMNVAEVAYEVGFNSPRYFSKYFKQEFGKLPSEYAKEFTGDI